MPLQTKYINNLVKKAKILDYINNKFLTICFQTLYKK